MSAPGSPNLRTFTAFCASVLRRVFDDRCFQVAAGLTYTTLLSLVPLFAVVLAVSAAFPAFDQWIEALQQFAIRNLLPDMGRKLIRTQLTEFTNEWSGAEWRSSRALIHSIPSLLRRQFPSDRALCS